MLEKLQAKLDEAMYKELKNSLYAKHIESIDDVITQIQKDYPVFNPEDVVTKLSDLAETASEEEAKLMIKYKNKFSSIIKHEIENYKQVLMAA